MADRPLENVPDNVLDDLEEIVAALYHVSEIVLNPLVTLNVGNQTVQDAMNRIQPILEEEYAMREYEETQSNG
jgi:hypothetical protein